MKLSKNFSSHEFECKCANDCTGVPISGELVYVLQELRDTFDKPIQITSGHRCPEHNKAEGGSPRSQHVLGTATDFKVKDTKATEVYNYLDDKYPDKYGIGLYWNRVHVDVRTNRARWDKS